MKRKESFLLLRQDFSTKLAEKKDQRIFLEHPEEGYKESCDISLPLVIHWFAGACCGGCWAGAPPNISANGLPNCNRSSKAFVCCGWAAAWSAAPKKSTILPDPPGGDARKGFVAFDPGDPTFDWRERKSKKVKIKYFKWRSTRKPCIDSLLLLPLPTFELSSPRQFHCYANRISLTTLPFQTMS